MLTIKNQYKLVAEDIVVSKNGTNEHWIVDDVAETPGVYDIIVLRKQGIFDTIKRTIRVIKEKNELGMYSVQIIQRGKIIDRDNIRLSNIKTAEGMLDELKTIMELM
jgi:predicted DNA-binding protein YlxM (UPF0122 family)